MVYGLGLLAAGEQGGHGSAEAVSSTSTRPGRAVTERHSPAVFTDPAVPLHGLQSLVCPTCARVLLGPACAWESSGRVTRKRAASQEYRHTAPCPFPQRCVPPSEIWVLHRSSLGSCQHATSYCRVSPSPACIGRVSCGCTSPAGLSSLVSCWHSTIPLRSRKIKPLLVKKDMSRTMCR